MRDIAMVRQLGLTIMPALARVLFALALQQSGERRFSG